MFIKSFKLSKKLIILFLITIVLLSSILIFYSFASEDDKKEEEKKDFIKWVDFNVTCEALNLTAKLDINSHNKNEETVYNWIELLAYLACKNGGDFKNFKPKDLTALTEELKNGQTMEDLTQNIKFYDYYFESYSAILGNFIGNYSIEVPNEDGSKSYQEKYGL